MKLIIPEAKYTFDASAKTITLLSPYNSLEIAQIFSIRDLTTTETLYDNELNDEPISLAGGVVTHTHASSSSKQTNSDILQIIIDVGSSASTPIHVSTGGTIASAVKDGRKTVSATGTAEALASDTPCKEVTVTAELDNTDVIVAGGSTVIADLATRRGTPLYAGDSTTIKTDNLAEVFLDVIVNGEGATYTYLT